MKAFTHLEAHHIHELTRKGELVNLMAEALKLRPLYEDLSPPRFALGHFHQMGIMPALSRQNPLVVQTKFVALNEGSGHSGHVLRFDARQGDLTAMISGQIFTSYRTAAASVAVAKFFRPQAQHIVLIGTGEQSLRHFEFFRAFYPETAITVVGRSLESLEKYRDNLGCHDLTLATTLPQRSAEIICTLTSSASPVLNTVSDQSLIIAAGACRPTHRELTSDLVQNCVRLVDSRPQAMREAGDYLIPLQEGKISSESIIEIGQVFRREVPSLTGPILYKSLGIPEQDVAYADYLLEKYHGRA